MSTSILPNSLPKVKEKQSVRTPDVLVYLADKWPFLYRFLPERPRLVLGSVMCLHCGRRLRGIYDTQEGLPTTRSRFSSGCICRLPSRTLEGLLSEDRDALTAYRLFRRAWLMKQQGYSQEQADRVTNAPLPQTLPGDIRRILKRRERQQKAIEKATDRMIREIVGGKK